MKSTYAKNTKVPVEKTEMQIKRFLLSRGASDIGNMETAAMIVVQFAISSRVVRLGMPKPAAPRNLMPAKAAAFVESSMRQRMRALLLVIKAKFEAISSGITTIEEEFLAHIVVSNDGTTVWETIKHEQGQLSPNAKLLLPSGKA